MVTRLSSPRLTSGIGKTAQTGATGAALSPNSTAQPLLEQGPANVNCSPRPCSQAQLNAADMQEALDPNQADPDPPTDSHDTPDYINNKKTLCVSRFRNWLWINVPEETQKKQWCEEACILCSEQGHFINECSKRQVVGQAVWTIDSEDCDFQFMKNDPVV
ncbi:hypothetical protein C0993_005122 [Termitomyces sp. T159_Od127]|nr:hypothetical protein C0993_005122 [Termitomyces sp. T159_Od127]